MKNWSTEDTKAVKEWLDVDAYRKFEELSLFRLYHELWARTLFFKSYRDEHENKAMMGYFEKIFSGDPFLIREEQLGYTTPTDKLFQPPHFLLTTTERLAQLCIVSMQRSMFFWNGGEEYEINKEYFERPVAETMPDQFPQTVMFEIDLASGTDEAIAEALKAALSQWRSIKGIDPNPIDSVRFGYGTIKKIINYRLIPMLDILLWANIKKVRVSDDRLSRLLYTDDDDESATRLHYQIKDTDRPLALKATTNGFIRQFNLFINKNSHLKNMRVSDVMKLSDSD
ncbi:DUF6387 family protein [Yersinia intermedia]|uniref:DUF6387 family protein n=1 Tax=Yersinia intermedia TaxID=631 RepID=UPI002244AD35|nr:DUF6387 family protein [Yersinia intermedia]MCW8112971.1 DUF6387 family protein [Yersinia intermedia]MDA5517860.1 DUF6387 family protein [Yersinia intermedia]